jgi:hypothetical protein
MRKHTIRVGHQVIINNIVFLPTVHWYLGEMVVDARVSILMRQSDLDRETHSTTLFELLVAMKSSIDFDALQADKHGVDHGINDGNNCGDDNDGGFPFQLPLGRHAEFQQWHTRTYYDGDGPPDIRQ